MTTLADATEAQLKALRAVYDRAPMPYDNPNRRLGTDETGVRRMTFDEYTQYITPMIGLSDCLMIPWMGMILGIEKDGYVHS